MDERLLLEAILRLRRDELEELIYFLGTRHTGFGGGYVNIVLTDAVSIVRVSSERGLLNPLIRELARSFPHILAGTSFLQLVSIENDAIRRTHDEGRNSTNLYIETDVLPNGHTINAQNQKIKLKRDSIMVFADDAPLYNWGHPSRYLLYNAETNNLYEEVAAAFPPYLTNAPDTYQLFYGQTEHPFVQSRRPRTTERVLQPIFNAANARYAILFSGASNYRHVNDLEFLYRTLVDVYQFAEENIYVLNYNGSADYNGDPQPARRWPGDKTNYRMKIRGEGRRAELEQVLDELKGRLKESDTLLIHTNNHGYYDGNGSFLVGYGEPPYYAADFAKKLGELPRFRCLIVMMEQCCSGGFIAPILAQSTAAMTSVATACEPDKPSIGGTDFDPFARDWIAAIAGANPDGRPLAHDPAADKDGEVSAQEAFNYASSVKHPEDTPMFDKANGGGDCSLVANTPPKKLQTMRGWHIGATPFITHHSSLLIDQRQLREVIGRDFG